MLLLHRVQNFFLSGLDPSYNRISLWINKVFLVQILIIFSVYIFCTHATPSSQPLRQLTSGRFVALSRLLLLFNSSKGLCVGHGPDGWFLIDELFTLEEWIDRQAAERGEKKHDSALNLEARVRTNCMIHSLRACYHAHYLVRYSQP